MQRGFPQLPPTYPLHLSQICSGGLREPPEDKGVEEEREDGSVRPAEMSTLTDISPWCYIEFHPVHFWFNEEVLAKTMGPALGFCSLVCRAKGELLWKLYVCHLGTQDNLIINCYGFELIYFDTLIGQF